MKRRGKKKRRDEEEEEGEGEDEECPSDALLGHSRVKRVKVENREKEREKTT